MPVLNDMPPNSITEKGADALVFFLNEALEEQKENIIEIVEEKFEAKLNIGLTGLKAEFKQDIAETKASLIKWMFIFWSGQIVVITAILFAFLKK